MPLLEQIGKQINDLGQRAVTSTGTFVEVTRLNDSINSIRLQLPIQYRKLGEAYYSLFNDGSGSPELQSLVDAINASFTEITKYQDAIMKAKGVVQCQSCGAEVTAGSLFCSSCGAKIIRETSKDDTPKCHRCGASVSVEDSFCMACGADLRENKTEMEE